MVVGRLDLTPGLLLRLMASYFFLNLIVQAPLEIGKYLQVVIVEYLRFARHAEVLEGEVALLVDVPVVVLRDLRRRYQIFRPYFLLLVTKWFTESL